LLGPRIRSDCPRWRESSRPRWPGAISPLFGDAGIKVETLEDLPLINREVTEAEISAFRVAEGVAA
jgi:hypothetical protein